jgi:hypothetical protein
MEAKPCNRCSRPASFSLCLLLSTLGIRPRVQRASGSVLFCRACLQTLIDSLSGSQPEVHSLLSGSFSRMPESLFASTSRSHPEVSKETP